MATTRIFVRGLPPSLAEDDFRTHFAKKYAVTDVKLLPQRRIGYVGFKTAEQAAAAVKYFNKSFMRMSRIAVELADPVGLLASLVRPVLEADLLAISRSHHSARRKPPPHVITMTARTR